MITIMLFRLLILTHTNVCTVSPLFYVLQPTLNIFIEIETAAVVYIRVSDSPPTECVGQVNMFEILCKRTLL